MDAAQQDSATTSSPSPAKRIMKRYKERNPEKAPVFLYKFLSNRSEHFAAGLVELLFSANIYLSARGGLNDPFDTRVHIATATDEQCEEFRQKILKSDVPASEGDRESIRADSADGIRARFRLAVESTLDNMGIYSLTETIDNALMWAHYANSHAGICLAFLSHDGKRSLDAFPILYGRDHFVVTGLDHGQIIDACLQKSDSWEYEKEWRIIESRKASTLHSVKPHFLRAIVLGIRSSPSTARTVRQMLEVRRELKLPLVRLFRAVQQPASYRLDFQQVWPSEGALFADFQEALIHAETHDI